VGPSHDRANLRSTQGAGRRRGPHARRCLLKGCECWFVPERPHARYCGTACRTAAARWRRWKAQRRYRQSAHGRACRGAQSRRHRQRQRERPRASERDRPCSTGAWVIAQRQIFRHLRSAWLLCDVLPSSSISAAAILWKVLSARAGTRDRARAPVAAALAGAAAPPRARATIASGAYCGARGARVGSP
jgi:hypothetical protein